MRSPIYWSGWIYRASMHALHGKDLKLRYSHIRSLILPGESVLDVGCGTGTLQSHLKGNEYLGIDLNTDFVRYAKKKGRNVIHQDALEFSRYKDFDVCVITDFLHHIAPRHKEFMESVLPQVKKRVIVCEPFESQGRHPIAKKLILMVDHDGINDSGEWMGEAELMRFYSGFNPSRIDNVCQSLIAVYDKSTGPREPVKTKTRPNPGERAKNAPKSRSKA